MSAAATTAQTPVLETASDYLGLTVEQRYSVASQHFPPWLMTEPIEFPAHHPTYGWACLVDECAGALSATCKDLLCSEHLKQYRAVKDSTDLDQFLRGAKAGQFAQLGWALTCKPDCAICGANRRATQLGYCQQHANSLRQARRKGLSDAQWRQSTHPLRAIDTCTVPRCAQDSAASCCGGHRVCRGHHRLWRRWLTVTNGRTDSHAWNAWLASAQVRDSVSLLSSRGQLSLAELPVGLQREIRYALHRHANIARRTQWRPTYLEKVVAALAESGVESLSDPLVADLAEKSHRNDGRRIWMTLPFAARSLTVTDEVAKSAGWFDPVLVGSSPFPGSQGQPNRRKVWDLTAVSQRWLRDLIWEHLRDDALKPVGKRPSTATLYNKITGIILLSQILRQNREDNGNDTNRLGRADAMAVKDTWDLWFREQIPLPLQNKNAKRASTLNELTRHRYMSGIRLVLHHSRKQHRTPPGLDSFIYGLPDYPIPTKNPRPRPLSYHDFQLLVNSESIDALETFDRHDIGLADIWLTQAFQGGRIGETLKLRLGCVGLIGAAQPYIWRDVSKANVIDYGMPCYLPVYERLLRRQQITRAKLRLRYAEQITVLDQRGRATLEAKWDRDMPLFPSAVRNPDLVIEVGQSWFNELFRPWFESLGLKGITTHQTRATLATSLLNNGAPAALVRQLLGHFSEEALAHYAKYNNDSMTQHLQQLWAAGPGMDKPGTILLRPTEVNANDTRAAAARIDLTVVPVEHGLCRYGPVVGGAQCPFEKNCSNGPKGPCEHFVLTGADLAYWERKRDAAYHFAEGAPTDEARDYILSQWHPWDPVLTALRDALDELGLLEEAEKLDLRTPVHDYFDPLFSTGWHVAQLNQPPPTT
ncbi:site-specific integrase [Mycolicibacterium canariasense]|uniref:site-specific integrase n=1 Tax=Mycolicibacterium canariasense TaxID=228230 RepID=UPI000788060B|nr:site-specific integrase [Mycolicibacterium canariasense]ORU98094.1 transposase [Mycolicibacterium canariasense]